MGLGLSGWKSHLSAMLEKDCLGAIFFESNEILVGVLLLISVLKKTSL